MDFNLKNLFSTKRYKVALLEEERKLKSATHIPEDSIDTETLIRSRFSISVSETPKLICNTESALGIINLAYKLPEVASIEQLGTGPKSSLEIELEQAGNIHSQRSVEWPQLKHPGHQGKSTLLSRGRHLRVEHPEIISRELLDRRRLELSLYQSRAAAEYQQETAELILDSATDKDFEVDLLGDEISSFKIMEDQASHTKPKDGDDVGDIPHPFQTPESTDHTSFRFPTVSFGEEGSTGAEGGRDTANVSGNDTTDLVVVDQPTSSSTANVSFPRGSTDPKQGGSGFDQSRASELLNVTTQEQINRYLSEAQGGGPGLNELPPFPNVVHTTDAENRESDGEAYSQGLHQTGPGGSAPLQFTTEGNPLPAATEEKFQNDPLASDGVDLGAIYQYMRSAETSASLLHQLKRDQEIMKNQIIQIHKFFEHVHKALYKVERRIDDVKQTQREHTGSMAALLTKSEGCSSSAALFTASIVQLEQKISNFSADFQDLKSTISVGFSRLDSSQISQHPSSQRDSFRPTGSLPASVPGVSSIPPENIKEQDINPDSLSSDWRDYYYKLIHAYELCAQGRAVPGTSAKEIAWAFCVRKGNLREGIEMLYPKIVGHEAVCADLVKNISFQSLQTLGRRIITSKNVSENAGLPPNATQLPYTGSAPRSVRASEVGKSAASGQPRGTSRSTSSTSQMLDRLFADMDKD